MIGWDDVPEKKPFPLETCESLSRFQSYFFPPLSTSEYRNLTEKSDKHVLNFYFKSEQVERGNIKYFLSLSYFVSIQFSPARTSTTNGTLNDTALSITDLICGCNSSHSFGGTSNTNSSCTCNKRRAW